MTGSEIMGVGLAFAIGAGCRWLDLPVPAPPKLLGAFMVVAMTAGFLMADAVLS